MEFLILWYRDLEKRFADTEASVQSAKKTLFDKISPINWITLKLLLILIHNFISGCYSDYGNTV